MLSLFIVLWMHSRIKRVHMEVSLDFEKLISLKFLVAFHLFLSQNEEPDSNFMTLYFKFAINMNFMHFESLFQGRPEKICEKFSGV